MNVLVTGASRGLGRVFARAFAEAGHRVAVHYLSNASEAQKTVHDITSRGGEAFALPADVRVPAQVEGLVQTVMDRWGSLDVLINNAGISRDGPLLGAAEQDWRDVLDVNLNGAFWCLRAAAQRMAKQKSGCILNIVSRVGARGAAGAANYAASKAGLAALTKSAARELGRYRIRVNALLPGFHRTGMTEALWNKHKETILAPHVLGRLTDDVELGRFVVQLCQAKSVSGQVFNFDNRVE